LSGIAGTQLFCQIASREAEPQEGLPKTLRLSQPDLISKAPNLPQLHRDSFLAPSDGFISPNENSDIAIALTYGLELVKRGAILVHSDARPLAANQTALDILSKKDGLSLSATGIAAHRAADTKQLIALFREAILHPHSGEPTGSPISVQRKTGATFIVRVVPGPEFKKWGPADARTALMTISDPALAPEAKERDLIRLYGLTRGEAAIAALVLQGKSIEEAAEALFISAHTARTHLKRIFLKTETHRQSELVVRLLSVLL
jgi:DNA-binding CsgD family transcriptional regulator